MKDRPILFQAAMVRALLDGSKTQTRRMAIKTSQPDVVVLSDYDADECKIEIKNKASGMRYWKACPYGQPGDQLWVRESWAEVARSEPLTDEDLPMRADNRILVYAADPQWDGSRPFLCADGVARWAKPARWTPSIHMPRWASRITLEITGVRVERLKVISEADARAEGVSYDPGEGGTFWVPSLGCASDTAAGSYRLLWESINGAGSWYANPWVWIVEFKVIKP